MSVDFKNLVPSVCGFYHLDLCHAVTAASDHEMTLLYFLRGDWLLKSHMFKTLLSKGGLAWAANIS